MAEEKKRDFKKNQQEMAEMLKNRLAAKKKQTEKKPAPAKAVFTASQKKPGDAESGSELGTPVPVLLVDDSAVMCKINRKMLAKWGLAESKIDICLSGQEALDFLKEKTPDFVLLDFHMPQMDGVSVLKHIRENEKTQGLPVIVLSSERRDDKKTRIMEAGADGYIHKPLGKLALMQALLKADKKGAKAIVDALAKGHGSVPQKNGEIFDIVELPAGLDPAALKPAIRKLNGAIAQGHKYFLLDFEHVKKTAYLDTKSFLWLHKTLSHQGGFVGFLDPSEDVVDAISKTILKSLFQIFSNATDFKSTINMLEGQHG